MKVIVKDIKVPVVKKDIKEDIKRKLKDTLKVPSSRIIDFRIVKQSIDARKPRDMVYWVFSVLVEVKGNIQLSEKVVPYDEPTLDFKLIKKKLVPVIVGAGPCGLFSALFLSYHGINGIVVERGCSIDERIAKVEKLWNEGILDIDCNPQFGEGGAGTFSDGKLVTRVKDPLIGFVLREFVRFGAHEKILIDSKPHVGTEYIRKIVKNIRDYLISKGWSFRFKEKVVDMETTNTRVKAVITEKGKIEGTHFIFAIGNSARDTFEMLLKQNVAITGKPFAIGFRVEHPQDLINENQYGRFKKFLPPASYTLTYNFKEDSRGVYSFCMCPGGYIICGSSEENTVVTNGMSYFKRDSSFANSAIVITVDKRDFPNAGPLGGVELQRILESKA
ncbi:MAG: FAD-dependent protein, partial [candidate division WOR-3 bacterium]